MSDGTSLYALSNHHYAGTSLLASTGGAYPNAAIGAANYGYATQPVLGSFGHGHHGGGGNYTWTGGGGGGGGGNSTERAGDGYDGGGRGYGTTAHYNYNSMPTGVNSVTHGSSTYDAIPNTGGGGGGGSYWSGNVGIAARSGSGGSGIVIVRYRAQ